jgi:hypothetical protein
MKCLIINLFAVQKQKKKSFRFCLGVGFWRGMKGLGRGKLLFVSFKKIRKGFGSFGGLISSNFKVSPNWGVLKG